RGKQRSVHNTYFTLPVIVAMLSNHYGWLYQGPHNWIVLVLLMLAGALIRHSFVARHKAHVQGRRTPWEYAVVGTLTIVALAAWLAPRPPSAEQLAAARAAEARPATYAAVRAIVDERCVMCHNAQLQQKNVDLHDAAGLKKNAQNVYQQAAVLKLMPLNNATQITEAERNTIKRWFDAGAPVQ
ncbi:MAG TPA: urate hydroxylase PuuD, partial [Rubrivivax sp.]|nr:urate hydroxylase PuuD [Rubrivivax sp.]